MYWQSYGFYKLCYLQRPHVLFFLQLFGSYHRKLEEEEPASWRDGVLTRVIKKMTNVENMKMKMKHPDGDSTPNTVRFS